MHIEQRQFCDRVKARFRHLFQGKSVLDCGSLDINGNNRYLFDGGTYIGLDLVEGPNVDHVGLIHEFTGGPFDVVISTEALEHDQYAERSFRNMISMVKPDGLLLLTCATTGRPEHGTRNCLAYASPGTLDYYRNIRPEEITILLAGSFRCWSVEIQHGDLYAWGLDKIVKC